MAKNALIRLARNSAAQVHLCSNAIGLMTILRVHVIPNAKIDGVAGEYGGAIKIKLRAPALGGKANAALIRFLAEQLKLPRHSIVLKHGHKSRDKIIRIDGLTAEDVRRRMCGRH